MSDELPRIIIRTSDGREWSSVLHHDELAALVAEAERIRAAGLPSNDHNPADVAAVAIGRAVRAGTL